MKWGKFCILPAEILYLQWIRDKTSVKGQGVAVTISHDFIQFVDLQGFLIAGERPWYDQRNTKNLFP
jgi:hypothetical protein